MKNELQTLVSKAQKLRGIALIMFSVMGTAQIMFFWDFIDLRWIRWLLALSSGVLYGFLYWWAIEKLSQKTTQVDGHFIASGVMYANAVLIVKFLINFQVGEIGFALYALLIVLRIYLPAAFIITLLRFVKNREPSILS